MENPSQKFNIRRPRKRTRYYVDNELLKLMGKMLKPHGIAIYNVLAKYSNSTTQTCFPSYETIMAESGVGKRNTVTKYLNVLEHLNVIFVDRRSAGRTRRANRYYLLDCGEWRINSISRDTIQKKKSVVNSISKDLEQYPFETDNSISKVANNASMDTLNHISKSDNIKSDKGNLSSFSNEKDERATHAQTLNKRTPAEQERINLKLKEMREQLTKKGILPPTP